MNRSEAIAGWSSWGLQASQPRKNDNFASGGLSRERKSSEIFAAFARELRADPAIVAQFSQIEGSGR